MPTRLIGTVLNAADGRTPQPGIVIEGYDPQTGFASSQQIPPVTATTDARGQFLLTGLEDRTWMGRRVSGGSISNYLIVQALERWQYDDVHGQLTTLGAHGHPQLSGITPNDHHNQSHVLATSSALGTDHSVSGLTTGHILTALSATTAAFQVPATNGTVTSVGVSGGTTGLTTSGGPITTSGTITLAGTLIVANGGTGAVTLTGILQGNGTSAITGIGNSSTVGQVLRVTGASTYAWGALDLTNANAVTGALPAANLGIHSHGSASQGGIDLLPRSIVVTQTGDLPSFFYGQATGTFNILEINASGATSVQTFWGYDGVLNLRKSSGTGDAMLLTVDAVGSGTLNSPDIIFRGRSNDGTNHLSEWKLFTLVDTTDGASTFTFQNRIDGASFATKLGIGNNGKLVLGAQATGITHAVQAARLISVGAGLSGGGDLTADRTISMPATGTPGTYTKVTTDTQGRVTSGTTLVAADLPTHDHSSASKGGSTLNPATLTVFDVTTMAGGTFVAGATGLITYTGSGFAFKDIGFDLAFTGFSSTSIGALTPSAPRSITFPNSDGNVLLWNTSNLPAAGALTYGAGANTAMAALAIGASGTILTVSGGIPAWATNAAVVDIARTWATLQKFPDNLFQIIGSVTASKVLLFEVDGAVAAKTMTLSAVHTLDRTVTIPDGGGNYTLAGLQIAQTWIGVQTFDNAGGGANVTAIFSGNASASDDIFQCKDNSTNRIASWRFASAPAGDYTITFPAVASTLVGTTAVQSITNKDIRPRVIVMSDATSFAPAQSTTDVATQANTQAIGTLTANAPTGGAPQSGQLLIIRIKSTNVQTFAWNAIYRGGTVALPTVTTGGGKTDYYEFRYNASDAKWDFMRSSLGF